MALRDLWGVGALMIFMVLCGAILFYFFVYTLFSRYAQGETVTIVLPHLKPIAVQLPPNTTLHVLGSLMVGVVLYLALDYFLSLARQRSSRSRQ
jgi:ABC-type Fe3+ transport system permease subunit